MNDSFPGCAGDGERYAIYLFAWERELSMLSLLVNPLFACEQEFYEGFNDSRSVCSRSVEVVSCAGLAVPSCGSLEGRQAHWV